MKKLTLVLLIIFFIPLVVIASPFKYRICNLGWQHVHHEHNEESYQQAWCNAHGGIMEYENSDFTRIDCLTKTHAIEFDFANKWHESIGQALHYGIMKNKKPMVILILDEPVTQMVYYKRVKKLGEKYRFDVKYVTNDILRLDEKRRCYNPKCKCHNKLKI